MGSSNSDSLSDNTANGFGEINSVDDVDEVGLTVFGCVFRFGLEPWAGLLSCDEGCGALIVDLLKLFVTSEQHSRCTGVHTLV